MSTKRSYILKQTCSSKVQVCLSMFDLLRDTRRERFNGDLTQILFQNLRWKGFKMYVSTTVVLQLIWLSHICLSGSVNIFSSIVIGRSEGRLFWKFSKTFRVIFPEETGFSKNVGYRPSIYKTWDKHEVVFVGIREVAVHCCFNEVIGLQLNTIFAEHLSANTCEQIFWRISFIFISGRLLLINWIRPCLSTSEISFLWHRRDHFQVIQLWGFCEFGFIFFKNPVSFCEEVHKQNYIVLDYFNDFCKQTTVDRKKEKNIA